MRPNSSAPERPGMPAISPPPEVCQRRRISARRWRNAVSGKCWSQTISCLVWPVRARRAQRRWQGCYEAPGKTRRLGLPGVSLGPVCLALAPASGGAGIEGRPLPERALQPAAVVGAGKIRAAGLDGGEKDGLQQILGFVRAPRHATRLPQQFDIRAGEQIGTLAGNGNER
jgi:hypothetical protein